MAAKGIATIAIGASAGALATVAGYYMASKIKQLFGRKPKMKLFNNQLLLSTRCTWFISELGAESDFELIDDDDMPAYPGETCPGKYLSTKPTDDEDGDAYKFQLVQYKKDQENDDNRSLYSNDSDFDDYDDRVGLVPALIVNDDFSMMEGAAICMYMADMYGQFQPPVERKAEYYSWIVYSAATFDGIVKTLHTQLHDQPASRRNDDLVESATQAFRAFARALTETLSTSDYLCGDTFTTADCVLGFTLWWAYTLEQGVLLQDFPVLLDYLQRLRERPAFQVTFGKEDTKWDWSNYFTKYIRAIKR